MEGSDGCLPTDEFQFDAVNAAHNNSKRLLETKTGPAKIAKLPFE